MKVYLERGSRRVFAGALDWPGWCRGAREESAALEALAAYRARYAAALAGSGVAFRAPADASAFQVAERLEGDATTDFGAPGAAPSDDERPVSPKQADRLVAILEACWRALDRAAVAAEGVELRKGPRGGGRELAAIVAHVAEAEGSYLSSFGGRRGEGEARAAIVETFRSRTRGEPPARTPRSGRLWTPRYAVRRVAWHALDHAWEIEDRASG